MLELIIFASGALIMVLEMVGARVMAPYLGTSVVVWTSLIGVVLACLAVGAFLGGRLADKNLSPRMLSRILAGAGLGCALTALCHSFVGSLVTSAIGNIYMAAVAAAIALFAFPAVLFGMISPYIIRLRLADIATSGATVGRLYALSTTGSIVGTFLGGFVLISFFASTHILLGTAASMIILSLLAYREQKKHMLASLMLLATLPVLAFIHSAQEDALAALGVYPTEETPYSSIRVWEARDNAGRPMRLMATDPGYAQSGMYIDDSGELLFDYTRFYALGTVLFPKAHDVLMLGGGGYSIPKWLLAGHGGLDSDALRVDVVELDAGMTRVAKASFGLKDDPRMRIFHEDARRYLNTNTQKYDLVFADVFNSHYSVPFHMGTVEAAQALRRALNDDGALVMNIISAFSGADAAMFHSIYGALAQVFPELYVFAVDRNVPRTSVQNFVVIALPKARADIAEIMHMEPAATPFSPHIQDMFASRVREAPELSVSYLRDEFAPVERYAQSLLKK